MLGGGNRIASKMRLLSQNKNLKTNKDSRTYPRRSCRKPLLIVHKYQNVRGLATNISRGGACVETRYGLLLGEKINLIFYGSKKDKALKLRGWIVRSDPAGVGVSFERRSGQERRYDLDRRTGLDRRKVPKR